MNFIKFGKVLCSILIVITFLGGCNIMLSDNNQDFCKKYEYREEIEQIYLNNKVLFNKLVNCFKDKKEVFADYMERNATGRVVIFDYNIYVWEKYFSDDEWNVIKNVFELTGPYEITYSKYNENAYAVSIIYIGPKKDDLSSGYVYYYFSDMNFQSSIDYSEYNVLEKVDDQWFYCPCKKISK